MEKQRGFNKTTGTATLQQTGVGSPPTPKRRSEECGAGEVNNNLRKNKNRLEGRELEKNTKKVFLKGKKRKDSY